VAELWKRSLERIDSQWPGLKYCSLGFYSAWILFMMGGSAVVPSSQELLQGNANNLLYLYSGVPLTIVLILCGAFSRRVEPTISRGPLVPAMSVLAAACTFFLMGGSGLPINGLTFALLGIGTGVGTSFLCLRIGYMYSSLDSMSVFFTTFASGMLANLLYFVCVGLDRWLSVLVISLFLICAMLLALLRPVDSREIDKTDAIPIKLLPRGFFLRCVLFVAVFSLAVGITKGTFTLQGEIEVVRAQAAMSVFVTLIVSAALVVVFALVNSVKRFDLSKIYYPVIIVAALGLLLAPLLGPEFLSLQAIIVNCAYNIFVLTLWCLFANIAGQTTMSPVCVFGFGRGASALGTTAGQLIVVCASSLVPGLFSFMSTISIVLVVLVLMMSFLVLDERTIESALEKTFREETLQAESRPETNVEERRKLAYDNLAGRAGLTAREREVLAYLGRGRSTSFIAEELGISYNTSKGHVRRIYAKLQVHSREELLDLIDDALRGIS
jgi:DNA-binding CsgD family transcriptional regulator